jgi:hypothetical protein
MKIDFEKFTSLHKAIEYRMIEIAELKNTPVLRFDRQLILDEDILIYISKDYDFGESKKSVVTIKISEINESDEYFITQYNEEVRLAKKKEEEIKQDRLREIEKNERKEYERLLKKFGPLLFQDLYKEPKSKVQENASLFDLVSCGQGGC